MFFILRRIFVTILLSAPSVAMDYHLMRGVHDIIPDDKKMYSPIYAIGKRHSDWFKRFRFTGPYTAKENLDQYDQLKGLKRDFPLTQTARLEQFLFPSPDGISFVKNQRQHFVLNGFSVETLGDLFTCATQAKSPDVIKEFLFARIKKGDRAQAGKLAEVIYRAFRESEGKDCPLPFLAHQTFVDYALDNPGAKKADLLTFMEHAGLVRPDAFPTEESKKEWLELVYTRQDYDNFLESLTSLKLPPEELARQRAFVGVYRDYKQGLVDSGQTTYWVNGVEQKQLPSADDYMLPAVAFGGRRATIDQLSPLAKSPEMLMFVGCAGRQYGSIRLDTPYSIAYFQEKSFSDCAEAALFGLINCMLYDSVNNQLDLSRLPVGTMPAVRELYQSTVGEQHRLGNFLPKWSTLMSGLVDDQIQYVRQAAEGGYELVSSVNNLVTVLEAIFGIKHSSVPLEGRLQGVLDLFSTEDRKLDVFGLEDERGKVPTVFGVSVDDMPILSVGSSRNHTSLEFFEEQESWAQSAAPKLLNMMVEGRADIQDIALLSLFSTQSLWNLFVSVGKGGVTLEEKKYLSWIFPAVLFSAPLDTAKGRLLCLESLKKMRYVDLVDPYPGIFERLNFSEIETIAAFVTLLVSKVPSEEEEGAVISDKNYGFSDSSRAVQFIKNKINDFKEQPFVSLIWSLASGEEGFMDIFDEEVKRGFPSVDFANPLSIFFVTAALNLTSIGTFEADSLHVVYGSDDDSDDDSEEEEFNDDLLDRFEKLVTFLVQKYETGTEMDKSRVSGLVNNCLGDTEGNFVPGLFLLNSFAGVPGFMFDDGDLFWATYHARNKPSGEKFWIRGLEIYLAQYAGSKIEEHFDHIKNHGLYYFVVNDDFATEDSMSRLGTYFRKFVHENKDRAIEILSKSGFCALFEKDKSLSGVILFDVLASEIPEVLYKSPYGFFHHFEREEVSDAHLDVLDRHWDGLMKEKTYCFGQSTETSVRNRGKVALADKMKAALAEKMK